MRQIRILAILLAVTAASNSCVRASLEEVYNKQEETIDKYISGELGRNEAYTVSYNEGSSRLTKVAGEGDELGSKGSVSFYYAGYTFTGSINNSGLFGTNHQATAESAGMKLTDQDFSLMEIDMKDGDLLEGVRNGLIGVKAGEECEILFSAKYGFGNSTFGIIPAKTALAFKIWVVGVSND